MYGRLATGIGRDSRMVWPEYMQTSSRARRWGRLKDKAVIRPHCIRL